MEEQCWHTKMVSSDGEVEEVAVEEEKALPGKATFFTIDPDEEEEALGPAPEPEPAPEPAPGEVLGGSTVVAMVVLVVALAAEAVLAGGAQVCF